MTNQKKYKKVAIKSTAAALLVAGGISIAGFESVKNNNEEKEKSNLEKGIAALNILSLTENDILENGVYPSIIERNSFMFDEAIVYDTLGIANDIASYDPDKIGMALYTVYKKLDTKTLNEVIKNLAHISAQLIDEKSELFYLFGDCNTFEDYLIKRGFICIGEYNMVRGDIKRYEEFEEKNISILYKLLEKEASLHKKEIEHQKARTLTKKGY